MLHDGKPVQWSVRHARHWLRRCYDMTQHSGWSRTDAVLVTEPAVLYTAAVVAAAAAVTDPAPSSSHH